MKGLSRTSFFFVLLLSTSIVYSQKSVSGKVVDSKTLEPLPFVNLVANGSQKGVATDIDGKFDLANWRDITSISCSYVGYEPLDYKVSKSENIVIELKRKAYDLKSIDVYPGDNPAHRIIDLVYQNRDKNNPEKNGSFTYESYNKLVATVLIDSATIQKNLAADSVDEDFVSFLDFIENQNLFLMESVTLRKFKPPNQSSEKVLATRVSGLKNPQFALVAHQLQDFTFYNEVFYLADREYINPISKNSTSKYLFVLEDTLLHESDSTFIISFRPMRGKHFDGLSGLLYINTNGYAIEKVLAEPTVYTKGVNITIQQNYKLIDGRKWFPVQTKSDLTFLASDTGGITVEGRVNGYYENIVLDPPLKRKEFSHLAMEIDPMAAKKPDEFWELHRKNELTVRDKNTYHFIDSLGEELNLDKKMYVLNAFISGKAPIKFINIDLDQLLKINGYEGVRLGLGIHTNDRISKRINVGGYGAYGIKDKAWKYGTDLNIKPFLRNDLTFRFSYINDVFETGGTEFYNKPKSPLNPSMYRPLYIKTMDTRERYQALVQFRAFRYLQPYFFVNSDLRMYNDSYRFVSPDPSLLNPLIAQHQLAEVGVGFRFAYNEKYIRMNSNEISLGTKAPVLFFKFTQGIKGGDLEGDLQYQRIEGKAVKLQKWRALGRTDLAITGGIATGETPRAILFNAPAAFWKYNISVDQAFQTMRINEFFSNQFANVFAKHSFPSIYTPVKEIKPVIVLYYNYGIGVMNSSSKRSSPTLRDYSLGFQEAGLGIDQLWTTNYSGLGIGAFYRFGAYEMSAPIDNWAIKLTFSFTFNIVNSTSIQ